jgi:hypothetical protein
MFAVARDELKKTARRLAVLISPASGAQHERFLSEKLTTTRKES